MDPHILSGTLGIVIIVFIVILFILWFLLPFAVFGIKGRLDKIIDQNKQIITLLNNSSDEPVLSNNENATKRIEPTIHPPVQVNSTPIKTKEPGQ